MARPYTVKEHETYKQQRLLMVTSVPADEVEQLCLAEIQDRPIREEYVDVGGKRWYLYLLGEVRYPDALIGPWLFAWTLHERTILMLTVCAAASAVNAQGHLDHDVVTQMILYALDRPGQPH